MEELIRYFDIGNVQKGAAMFDQDKLEWLNQQYIKTVPEGRLAELLGVELKRNGVDVGGGAALVDVARALKERAKTIGEMAESSRYFFVAPVSYDEKAARKHLEVITLVQLREALAALNDWTVPEIHSVVKEIAATNRLKIGKVAQPLRVALTGGTVSPPIDVTVKIIGKTETLQRLDKAIAYCGAAL